MSSDPADPLSQEVSSSTRRFVYITTKEKMQAIDFKISRKDGSDKNLMSLANSVNSLLRNQEVLINAINTLFQNQRIMMDTIIELREWKIKCLTQTASSDSIKEETIHLPEMPLTTLKEFLLFDRELKKNEILRKQFVKRVSEIKSTSGDKTIRAIMKFIISDELCTQITWSGLKKTVSMNDKKIPEIIFAALHRDPSCFNYKLKNVEYVVKSWLQQTRTRLRLEEIRKVRKALEYERNCRREKQILELDSKDFEKCPIEPNNTS